MIYSLNFAHFYYRFEARLKDGCITLAGKGDNQFHNPNMNSDP